MTFASYSYSIRQSLHAAGTTVSHGHVQQLLAAALGYGSLAAYQAAINEQFGSHVIVDMTQLTARSAQLVQPKFEEVFLSHFAKATPQKIHWNAQSLEDAISDHIRQNAADHDDLAGIIAQTNAIPTDVEDIEVMGIYSPLTLTGPNMLFPFFAVLEMDQDPERVYYGDKIVLDGMVAMAVTGRRCLGDFELSVTGNLSED